MEANLSRKMAIVVIAACSLALMWFCIWTVTTVSDTNTKVSEVHEILTSLSSARDLRLERRGQDNAENISDNSKRIEALEDRRQVK